MSATFESTTTLSTVRLPSLADLKKKAHLRLAERVDPAKTRHKPLSILRQETKRYLEQFFDQEGSFISKADRELTIQDLLAEALGVGVLEDLFREEANKEILILAHNQIISKKNDNWLPTSARFRDAAQLLSTLTHLTNSSEPLVPNGPACSGRDLRLPNGFRLLAILPPTVMEVAPQILLVRQGAPSLPATAPTPPVPAPALTPTPAIRPSASSGHDYGAVNVSLKDRNNSSGGSGDVPLGASVRNIDQQASGRLGPAMNGPTSGIMDPYMRFRQKVAERIVIKFAGAGIYDLNQVPIGDLQRIVLAHVIEYCEQEKMGYDDSTQERLALEILANMNRS